MVKPAFGSSVTFLNMLQILFIAFKLAGIITWSWWLVLSPYLIVALVVMLAGAAIGVGKNARYS